MTTEIEREIHERVKIRKKEFVAKMKLKMKEREKEREKNSKINIRVVTGYIDNHIKTLRILYEIEVQRLVDEYGVELATGNLSNIWQVYDKKTNTWMGAYDYRSKKRRVPGILIKLDKLDEKIGKYGIWPSESCNCLRYKPNKPNKPKEGR